MRVALCYHGIAKGTNFKNGGLPVGFEYEFDLITKNLIQYNSEYTFDIFLHSWSVEYKDLVIKKIRPKDYTFEEKKIFKRPTLKKRIKERLKKFFGKGYELDRMNNIYSRWYSFLKVCDLVKKSDVNYDLIIVTRFDMCLLKPFSLKKINPNYFYSGDWVNYFDNNKELLEEEYKNKSASTSVKKKGYPYDEEGLQDFFFVSSQEYVVGSFSNIFNQLKFLIRKYGSSNHLIAYGKMKEDNMLRKHKRILDYGNDYFLSRWL